MKQFEVTKRNWFVLRYHMLKIPTPFHWWELHIDRFESRFVYFYHTQWSGSLLVYYGALYPGTINRCLWIKLQQLEPDTWTRLLPVYNATTTTQPDGIQEYGAIDCRHMSYAMWVVVIMTMSNGRPLLQHKMNPGHGRTADVINS